nr:serine/threonine protein kinase related protein [uncultured archaeon GZfos1D1]
MSDRSDMSGHLKHAMKILLALLMILILAQSAHADDWPMYMHDASRTGASDEIVEPPLELIWKYKHVEFSSSPAVSGGVVYVGSYDNNIYAFDATTGSLKWKYETGDYVTSSPAVSGGVVYVGSHDANIYALNAATGALKWKYETGDKIRSSPAVSGGIVYFISLDDYWYALDAATGALKWKYDTDYGGSGLSPAVSGGIFYGELIGDVIALDAATGVIEWKYDMNLYNSVDFLVVSGDIIYVGSNYNVGSISSDLCALDAATGTLKWKYEILEDNIELLAVSGGIVYVGSMVELYALDATTGALKWIYEPDFHLSSPLAISGDVVYVGSREIEKKWGLVEDKSEHLYALDAATGALKWKYNLGDHGIASPAISGGIVYVKSEGLFAFAPSKSEKSYSSIIFIIFSLAAGGVIFIFILYQKRKTPFKEYRAKMEEWEKKGYDVSELKEVLGDEK